MAILAADFSVSATEHVKNIVALGFSGFMIGGLWSLMNSLNAPTFDLHLAIPGALVGGGYYAVKQVVGYLETSTGIPAPAALPAGSTPAVAKKTIVSRML